MKKNTLIFTIILSLALSWAENENMPMNFKNTLDNQVSDKVLFSNLETIIFELDYPLINEEKLQKNKEVKINPESKEGLQNWITVTVKPKGGEESIPIKVSSKISVNGKLELSLQILESDEEIDAKVDSYIKKLTNLAQKKYDKNPSQSNLNVLQSYGSKKAQLPAVFRKYYLENKVGEYDLEIVFESEDSKKPSTFWESSIQVLHEGECLCEIFER